MDFFDEDNFDVDLKQSYENLNNGPNEMLESNSDTVELDGLNLNKPKTRDNSFEVFGEVVDSYGDKVKFVSINFLNDTNEKYLSIKTDRYGRFYYKF